MPPANRAFDAHQYFFAELGSTQSYLLEHAPSELPVFCRALMQTAGRGQRGAAWQSPAGGLYFSLRLNFPHAPQLMAGLAQLTALAIAEYLDPSAQTLQLKWPNDLYIAGKKLGGILIDVLPAGENACSAVIGVGINLEPRAENTASLAADFAGKTLDYAALCHALLRSFQRWQQTPYLPAAHRWSEYDLYKDRQIELEGRDKPVQNCGIDQNGRLIVKDSAGIHFLASAKIRQPPAAQP